MPELTETVAADLAARYEKLAGYVRDLAAPLTEQQFWTKPFPFGNSFGHLVLHLTGNLNYYIGAQIAATGYVRDRPREFTETALPPKEGVLTSFSGAVDMVVETIREQSSEDWSTPYTATGADARDRFEIVLQCATHLHHHIGQMVYICFAMKGKS
jgi:hypothetical protein